MLLGMSLRAFTIVHVVISLIGIISGLVAIGNWVRGRNSSLWTSTFLLTTILTSVTGFMFPFEKVTPAIILGGISLAVLAAAIVASSAGHLHGGWRFLYVASCVAALYFNCFVLVVQLFLKIPVLHALAPTGKEPPFAVAQLVVLVAFVILWWKANKGFRPGAHAAAAVVQAR
jgi:hypothetical protein